MGSGAYSHAAHRQLLQDRASTPAEEVFRQQACHPLMNPHGVRVRECRDSADHPTALPIVFALDVTGSMGDIPRMLAAEQLPGFMKMLGDCGVQDPQILFMAVGDATSDRAPLQVGQFESTAQLMDQWLTWSFLEGNGGGQGTESYELAMYFLAQHTEHDHAVKRGKKGYAVFTGDELPYPVLSRHIAEAVLGDRLDGDLTVEEIVAVLGETWVPFFVIPDPGRRARCEDRWRALLGQHVLCAERPEDVCWVSVGAILLHERVVPDTARLGDLLRDAGLARDRVAAVVHALRGLDPDAPAWTPSAATSVERGWFAAFRRLLGG